MPTVVLVGTNLPHMICPGAGVLLGNAFGAGGYSRSDSCSTACKNGRLDVECMSMSASDLKEVRISAVSCSKDSGCVRSRYKAPERRVAVVSLPAARNITAAPMYSGYVMAFSSLARRIYDTFHITSVIESIHTWHIKYGGNTKIRPLRLPLHPLINLILANLNLILPILNEPSRHNSQHQQLLQG